MLSRPTAYRDVTSPVERVQTAAIFGMLGVVLGVLVVAAALWLLSLHGRIQEQSESLKILSHSIEQSSASQRLAVDTVLEKVRDVDPAEFIERYDKTVKARDDAVQKLNIQRAINETLASRNKELESTLVSKTEALRPRNKGPPGTKRTPRRPNVSMRTSSNSTNPWIVKRSSSMSLRLGLIPRMARGPSQS